MIVKETVEDIELDALLSEEKESDTYVKKVVAKIDNGVAMDGASYKKIGGVKGESLSPDVSQWRKEHDKLAGEASKIRRALVGGMGDKDKIAAALKDLRAKVTRIKALRKSVTKNIGKAAAKPGVQKASRSRASAAQKEAVQKATKKAEKSASRSEWAGKVKDNLKSPLANFGSFKRGK
jgi:hypothetical protein